MMGDILDGITIISAIMKEQGCTWDEASRLWGISMEVEAERRARADAESNVIQFPVRQ